MTYDERHAAPTMPPSAEETASMAAYVEALGQTSISFLALVRCPPSPEFAASLARYISPSAQ